MIDLPHDSDGDAIRSVVSHGSDLSRPMEIDFHIAGPSADVAERVATETRLIGFRSHVVKDETGGFTTWCTKLMVLNYQAVIDVQTQLSEIAIPLGAYSDGWGTLGNGKAN